MRARLLSLLAVGALAHTAHAQEAINTPAATQPGAGRFVARTQLVIREFGNDPTPNDSAGRDIAVRTIAIVGLTGSLSLEARTLGILRADFTHDDTSPHWGETELTVKWRAWQHDIGPVDTMRFSLLAGLELPTGTDGMSSHSVDPTLGAVFTGIFGRHGINQAVRWKHTTGDLAAPTYAGDSRSDAVFLDTAYLYRLLPAQYAADTEGSWYALLELNSALETNGDSEILIGPGILYEGRRIALEAAIQLPLHHHLDERPETRWAVTIGIRFLF